eukprot:TRINITY_DN3094_c0_g1_i1.p1 TRINITY_DN3094_c0_g1~~TRINITY_DN3094_c0_g1_i1.p1  ORF type:complete len:770 (+),score=328.63 TRINITY_DN3094_c0_g1_i1:40-2349(+)
MPELLIGPTPGQELVIGNNVFCAPGTFARQTGYLLIKGQDRGAADYVFTFQEHEAVPPGSVAFNKWQRTCCKLSVNIDKLFIDMYQPPKRNFLLTSITLELDFANPKKAQDYLTIDATRFLNSLKKLYANQVFAVDQQLGLEFEGVMLQFKVLQTEVLNEDTGTLELADGLKAKFYMGMLSADSQIYLRKPTGRNIKFDNMPKGAELMQTSNLLKSGFNFESYGIGGLDAEADKVFRRAFASRIFPASFLSKLGVSHVKGILLYGPPGCGKTLMARQIGKMLNCKPPKIVNGPEILSKYVGESEKNVRLLFEPAEKEQAEKGDESELHLIIFDEFDAIVKQRGSTRDNTGVADSVVNQLLSKIDGVDSLNNVLLVGMTNRKDLIDEALLRPGRFEVQIEIQLPDKAGRKQIFTIHTSKHKKEGTLADDVDIDALAERAKNYTGAEIEGVVKAATSFALRRLIDYDNPTKPMGTDIHVTMADFIEAMEDVKPAFGAARDLSTYMRRGIFDYGNVWQEQMRRCMSYVAPLKTGGTQQVQSVLLEGSIGTGKTALATYIATCAGFPFVKVVTGDDMTGLFENSKVNFIKKAFDDAHKSPYSVVVLDEVEDLIDYTSEGPRFSSPILQCLRRMIKKVPPLGSRILVLGTTANPAAMKQLDFFDQWDVVHKVLELSRQDVPAVLNHMGVKFVSREEEAAALNDPSMPSFIAIKKLMQLAEMARALALGPDGLPQLSDTRDKDGKGLLLSETQWKPITTHHWKQSLDNLGLSENL